MWILDASNSFCFGQINRTSLAVVFIGSFGSISSAINRGINYNVLHLPRGVLT